MRAPIVLSFFTAGVLGGCKADCYLDGDGDGFGDPDFPVACDDKPYTVDNADDCDDSDPASPPGLDEVCDGADNDCNGVIDDVDFEALDRYVDADGDGVGDALLTDCAQFDQSVAASGDCDDSDPLAVPGREEACDGIDNDCNGLVDDGVTWTVYIDADGDGFGDPSTPQEVCSEVAGTVLDGTDCDDTEATIHPGALERCNEVDDDCDTEVDEGDAVDPETWHLDSDGDGYGDPARATDACVAPSGYVGNSADCDDVDPAVSPDATEQCNAVDDDCDGTTDESDATDAPTWFLDADGDGYGRFDIYEVACTAPADFVDNDTDCDDSEVHVHPGATETCNLVDDNCDTLVDDDDPAIDTSTYSTWYADADGDGEGDPDDSVSSCASPSGYLANDLDCDDTDATVHTGAQEVCDGIDNDCDGSVDPNTALGTSTFYADSDSDGYGDPSSTQDACNAPPGHVSDDTDCDDSNATVNPGATEVCDNGMDDDCDDSPGFCPFDGSGIGSLSSATLTDPTSLQTAALVGDLDGRGGVDIFAGSTAHGTYNGEAWLVYGPSTGGPVRIVAGFTIEGEDASDTLNRGGAVDIDHDGYADLFVPANGYDSPGSSANGAVYHIAGPITSGSIVADASTTDTVITGSGYGDQLGSDPPRAVGDLDGDGFEDLALIAATANNFGNEREGAIYLIYSTPTTDDVESIADASLWGAAGHHLLRQVEAGGDINGDGVADLLVGTEEYSAGGGSEGRVYVELGPFSGSRQVGTHTWFTGSSAGDRLGVRSPATDLNDDGYDDYIIGARSYDNGTYSDAGRVFVMFGDASTMPISAHPSNTADVIIDGVGDEQIGSNTVTADLNDDGYADLLVDGPHATVGSDTKAGSVYLFSGPLTAGTYSSADAAGVVSGAGSNHYLSLGDGTGDHDGDGIDDVILYATGTNSAYLLPGGGI